MGARMKQIKLSQWAKKQGIHYNTALKWFKAGKIPNAVQLNTRSIMVADDEVNESVIEKELKKIVLLLERINSKLKD